MLFSPVLIILLSAFLENDEFTESRALPCPGHPRRFLTPAGGTRDLTGHCYGAYYEIALRRSPHLSRINDHPCCPVSIV